ncbi:hypothetical protein GQ43DRAFT_413023 [Delitschia confertaspora ATCC 74209]|uniref:PARP catalytic domain-containing protein n=1 Tax=Delitschia confertaspora ATCC 74209 TaxID=1513339 RepID=A0A9P4JUF2_9PLEO|nr:hypothetical protein GQ43DRAFT_413023 [Delitschia confertaspora ATCC 74209]
MPDDKLQAVMKFFDDEEAKILKEAERLKAIQTALKLKDPKGTTSLLFQLGIKDTTPLEDELEKLPPDLRANIDTVEGNVVEMNFPLIKFTELQKKAMGSGTANAMIVRLVVDHSKTFQTSFCCHLDNETKSEREYHYPWDQSASKKAHNGPIQQHCHGKMTPLTWQMTRILHRYLKKGHPTLYYIHEHIQERLSQLPYHCIVCDLIHNGSQDPQLRRSTVCHSISCKQIWPKVPLHIRIPELRSDPAVVDLILTTVYAAAMTARMDLLPNCPIRSTNTVLSILGTIPAVKVLQTTNALEQRLALGHQDAEKLLTWACTTFRGFLTSAPSNLRIPGFGQHQFLLANASPEIEAAFLMRRAIHHPDGSTGKVLFHGTPLERLPSILQQGLKICSGTPLQRIGAAHGNGIYMAEDPATSYGYSSTCHNSWQNSKFKNMRVLLGCEVVGPGNRVQSATGGVHLLKEEREVMIRYVFLMEQGAHTPPRQQVENVMESAFWGLRRGTV